MVRQIIHVSDNLIIFADKLNGRAYRDSFDDVKQEAKENGLVIVYGASDDLMEFDGAIYDEGGCFDGGRVYFDRDGVDQEGGRTCKLDRCGLV